MPVFKRDREEQQQNSREHIVSEMKARIYKQAGLAVTAILVTVVLLFAMSTAWYSNVLEAGTLTFQAEKWELNAGDLSSYGNVIAQPGARGILPVSYKNTGDSTMNAYISVSKEDMETELKKRVYFYTETPYTVERKGNSEGESKKETVSRRYLTNGTAAPYTVLGRGQLTMSDDFCSVDTPIYWEWVYDLLGYYVRVSSTPASDDSAVELEYLRPIVYDYDKATFDKNGNLATVNGEHFELLLQRLSETDGFLNTFTPNFPKVYTDSSGRSATYYIVDNENEETLGYYTAIRLLTKPEIADANLWDTEQGKNGKPFNDLKITITGETANIEAKPVNTSEELIKALQSKEGGYFRLQGDLNLTQGIQFNQTQPITLDLGGNTLTAESGISTMFLVNSGAQLTVLNGSVKGTGAGNIAFASLNGQLTLSNVRVENTGVAVYITDESGKSADPDSTVYITGSTLVGSATNQPAVMVLGNGTTTAQKTRCVIEDSTIEAPNYIGISGIGEKGTAGTEIQLRRCTVTGKDAAIYHPQDNSTLKAENTVLKGNTGIAVKGGTVYLDNCVVTGSATATLAGAFNNNGFTDTGAAVYLEAGYERDNIAIYITGENTDIKAAEQKAVLLYHDEKDTKTRKARIAISGGTYSSDVTGYLANLLFQCKVDDNSGTYTVTRKEAQSGS